MADTELSAGSDKARSIEDDPGTAPVPLHRIPLPLERVQARAAVVAHAVSLTAAGTLLVWFNRRQWFFGDEWEFFANRLHGGGRALFGPHNEHWSTLPILIYRGLYAAFGLRSYLPYVVVVLALHLAVTHLAWRLLRHTGTPPLVASALAGVFALLGAGYENLLWAFQVGFVGSVALGLVHILLVDHSGPFGRRDRIAWAVAVLGLTFSGISLTMTAVSGLVVALRRNVKDAVLTVAPPAAVYLVWLLWIGHEGLRNDGSLVDALLTVPSYVWTGLSGALERAGGLPGAGPTLVVLLAVWLVRQQEARSPQAATATAMAVGAALLFAVIGMGRSGHGVEQATSSRYVYLAVALLLPTLGRVLASPGLRSLPRQAVLIGLLGLVLLNGLDVLRRNSSAEGDREVQLRAQILAADRLVASGAEVVGVHPEPKFAPDLTVDVLRALREDEALPAGIEVTESDELAVANQLQVALTAAPPEASAGDAITAPTLSRGEGVAPDGVGCAVLSGSPARADLRLDAATTVEIRASAGSKLTVTLRSLLNPAVAAPPRTIALPAETSWLRVSRPGPVSIGLPAGATGQLCGVQLALAG